MRRRLVKVARSPWDYLPEAVTAATRILKERGITAEEIAAEEWDLAQKEMSDALAKRRFGDYFDWVRELLPTPAGEGSVSRQKPFGWALVMVQAVVVSANRFGLFYGHYAHHADLEPLLITYIPPLLISAGVIIFLWRPFALEFFGVSNKYRNIAMLVAILLGIALATAV